MNDRGIMIRQMAAVLLALLAVSSPVLAQQATSSNEALTVYADAANFQNGGAFELAAEEWQKFLKSYPTDPLAPKAQHYLGVCQLQLKQTEAAAASFAAVIKNHPKFELLEDAWLNLASCQYTLASGGNKEMYPQAAESFATLLKEYPRGKYVEDALFYLGESLYAQGKKDEATAAYERLVDEFPESKRRADGLYALGVTREELGQHVAAGKTYDTFLKEFPDSLLATEVRMRKAETVLQEGDAASAARLFAEVAAVPDFAAADHALMRQAFALARMEKFGEAGNVYAKVATEFADSSYAAEATIAAGRSFYRAAAADEAATWLRKAMERGDANATEAAHWLARLLIKQGKAADAAEIAQRQLASHSQRPSAQSPFAVHLQLDLADALYEVPAKRGESLDLYVKFLAANPQHELAPQALYNAAFAALELKQYEAGRKHAERFLTSFPQDGLAPDAKYVAAECSLQMKDYEQAVKYYRELAENYAEHADRERWLVRQGLVSYLQKDYPAVVAILAPLADKLQSADARAEALFLLGASQFYSDKFEEAAAVLSAAREANPQARQADEALLLLARCEARLNQPAKARELLEKLLAEYPKSPLLDQAHYRLGELHYAAEDYAAAVRSYAIVAEMYADSGFAPYALLGQGWSQLKSQKFAGGAETFTVLLSKYPDHPLASEAHFGRGLCRRQSGDPQGAVADIQTFLKNKPNEGGDAVYELGLAQVAAGDYACAVTTLEGLLGGDFKYAAADKVLYEIGWALKSQDKHAEAVPYFTRLANEYKHSPLAAEAAFHVGENHYEKKQYAEAAQAYALALLPEPSGELGEKATYKLGWTQFQQKKYDEALASFEKQLAGYPEGPLAGDARFMKAECLFRQEKYDQAWPAYQAALATKSSTPTMQQLALLHGGQSAAQIKKWDESAALLSKLIEQHPETPLLAEALYERGWARQNMNQTAEALADYEAAAARSRDAVGARARFMRGELLFAEKKHDQAIREFQRAMFGYGGDQAPAETKNWQAKSGYEAGRCAEVLLGGATAAETRQKLLADATRFYRFVVEKHPDHELADEAKRRLEALAKL